MRALVLLAVASLAAGALAVALRRTRRPSEDRVMGFLEHVDELRRRLVTSTAALLVGVVFSLSFRWEPWRGAWLPKPSLYDPWAAQVLRRIADDLVPDGVQLVVTRPMDAFMAEFWVALGLGVAMAIPVVVGQMAAFFGPALRSRERRMLRRAVTPVVALFVAGAAFAYVLVLPTTLRALYTFAGPIEATPLLAVGDLAAFALHFMVAFGVAFQLPLVLYVLARVGLFDWRSGLRLWRHAVVAIVVLSAFLTPDPTFVSQAMMAAPLLVLYFGGIGLARMAERRAPEG